jgi:amino acid adenylation domain-containing protein
MIGMFVNTVVVRMKFDKDLTFKDLLKITDVLILEAIAHQDLPFEKIVEIVNPERIENVNPLFQVAFAWDDGLNFSHKLEGIKSERVLIKDTVSPLDITFYAWENDGIIEGEIEFNSDLFERNTITRMKENFMYLLEKVFEYPDKMLSDINIVSDHEKKIIEKFNNTEVPIPDCLIQTLFEKQVVASPTKVAIISGLRTLTYKELDDQSNILANRLINLGVVQGDSIGIFIERSAEMIISVLSILKAGCCYLPLDPELPLERLGFMIEESGTKFIITQKSLKNKSVFFKNAFFVIIDEEGKREQKKHIVRPDNKSDAQSFAYLLYTSGSTGKPKGVKIKHQSVVNLIQSMSKKPGVNINDVLLAVVTLSFDMSVFEIFLPLSNGATVVVADSTDIRDGHALIRLIEKFSITILQAAPSIFHILLASGWKGKTNLRALCGGEALTSGIVKKILPNVRELWNCYGPTETTVFSTLMQITDSEEKIHIGKPLNNTQIFILDKFNNPLPVGVTGEIAIGGLGVSEGYLNQPALTLEKFIRLNGENVIYKTGDSGRWLPDGNIELFGRIDNQIKIRGNRVEPSEIEVILSDIEGIKESVVKLQKFGEDDERLVAFLNVKDSFEMGTREVMAILKEKLPSYMVPAYIRFMHEFPLTMNGKIDKKALQYNSDETADERNMKVQEFTNTGEIIYKIWSEVLRTKNILPDDDFFEIGGNSLLALNAHSKIESEFNIKFHLRVFFYGPRIRAISNYIDNLMKIAVESNTPDKNEKISSKIVKGEI